VETLAQSRRSTLAFFLTTFLAALGLLALGAAAASATQAPIAAYSFDAGTGSTLEDLTGSGHDGTIEGATWTTKGKYGGALQFDGTDDCVSVPASAEFQFLEAEEFTLEAWVRPDGENAQAVLTQEDENQAPGEDPFSYSMLVGAEEEAPKGWLREGGESGHLGVLGGDPLPLHTWSHLAFTDDGAKIRIYVDGELRATQNASR
jgi:Concanavalin A-like lectin/glucanases superfamily